MMSDVKTRIITELIKLWPENKAKGILAQTKFKLDLQAKYPSKYSVKLFKGCWVLAPYREEFFKYRFCFFVHDSTVKAKPPEEIEPEELIDEGWRFHSIANFLKTAGLGVYYVVPIGNFFDPQWKIYEYKNESLISIDEHEFFKHWPRKGRPSYSRTQTWDTEIINEFKNLDEELLISLLLNELFYTSFLKSYMRKPVSDPYDVDYFLVSHRGAVLPVEIKEKFPAVSGSMPFFGIDAGRLLMLLRLCLPNDSNAIYLIRHVERHSRNFIGWKFMLLSEIIMTASWNLQRGGRGMGGQETQTIRLPYSYFRTFDANTYLQDDIMENIRYLPNHVKRIATEFKISLEKFVGGQI